MNQLLKTGFEIILDGLEVLGTLLSDGFQVPRMGLLDLLNSAIMGSSDSLDDGLDIIEVLGALWLSNIVVLLGVIIDVLDDF